MNTKTLWTDVAGMTAGSLCMIQCLVLPFFPFLMLSVVEQYEPLLLGVGVVMAAISCAMCCWKGQRGPAVMLMLGLAAMLAMWLGNAPERWWAGVALLWVTGHIWAFVQRRASKATHTTHATPCCSRH